MAKPSSIEAVDEPLVTRLLPPPLRATLVARQRLRDELRFGLAHGLTLITAPAGSGKSTLLAQALADARAADPAAGIAWLALDGGDNDPPRFWRYIIAALKRAVPAPWLRAEQLLGATAARPAEPLVTALLNAAAALPHPLILAIDDYHSITAPEIHAGLALLVERAPPQLQLVLASRSLPPLPLERLRVRGRLAELRSSELRFTLDEAGELFDQVLNLPLAPATLAELVARTEGWGAGLILAALAARGHDRPAQAIAAFRGTATAVIDYVAAEVLAGQPPELQAFLLRTAALDRFSAELCDALGDDAARADSRPAAALLAQIERANLFLIPLDDERHWFRYHHLFAEVLRAYLSRSDPAALRATRLRAAAWLAGHGAHAEAIGLALAAEEWPLAARLITEVGRATLLRNEVYTLRGWLSSLPPAVRSATPPLLLLDGWVRVLLSDLDGAEALAAAVPADAVELHGEMQLLLTMIAILRGTPAAEQPAGAAPDSSFLQIIATLNEGFLAQFSGDVPAALQAFEHAAQLSHAEGNDLITFIAWCQLGEVQLLQGCPHMAEASYTRALDYATGGSQAPFADAVLVGLGTAAYERGDLAQAASQIATGLARRSILSDLAGVDGELLLAMLAVLRGDDRAAAEHLRAAEGLAQSLNNAAFIAAVHAGKAAIIARTNDRAAAAAWLAAAPPPPAAPALLCEIAQLARAQVLYTLGRHAEALALAEHVAEAAAAGRRGRHQAEALVLRALALDGLGRRDAARAALAEAHALADPAGLAAVFFEAAPALAALDQPPAPTPDALTAREIEVLRLIAAGLSNGEIAAQLVVAPSTIKKHINRIFDKLDVRSRTQALVQARSRGLFG